MAIPQGTINHRGHSTPTPWPGCMDAVSKKTTQQAAMTPAKRRPWRRRAPGPCWANGGGASGAGTAAAMFAGQSGRSLITVVSSP